MRVFQISLLALGLVLLFSGEAQAVGCMPRLVPDATEKFISGVYVSLMQGGWCYLIYTFAIVASYYLVRRFKPALKSKASWVVVATGVVGIHAIQQRIVYSSGGYCDRIGEWADGMELATAWCIASLVFYGCYRLILLVPDRYRPFVAIGTPIGMAIGLPALSFLIFMLTK